MFKFANLHVCFCLCSYYRRERKYFPVHKMSKRMSNTLRRIYKNNLLCEQGYPSAPEHQSSFSENTPESPVRSLVHSPVKLYAELDESQEARSVIVPPPAKSPKLSQPVSGGISMSPKMPSQRKIRHRRLGSADSNYHFILPKQCDRRNVRMVNMETQTDALDNISVTNMNVYEMASTFSAMSVKEEQLDETPDSDQVEQSSDVISMENGNLSATKKCEDTVDHPPNLCSDEQLIYDYMNSNEQLDIRESSDEDNVEVLNRRVSQFFTQNGLLQTENGNGSIIDNRLLLNIMAARRSCISINDKDEVTVMSRSNGRGNSFRTSTTAGMFGTHINDSSRRSSISYKISDHNCNNDDGDDSWTDEEGEESDHNYSLRRKRFRFTKNILNNIGNVFNHFLN